MADQRRSYAAGPLEAGRVVELEQLGMVWSEQDAAWADGSPSPSSTPPPTATSSRQRPRCGTRIRSGCGQKNARAAAHRARENEELRAAGRPVRSSAGAMTEARQSATTTTPPPSSPPRQEEPGATMPRRPHTVTPASQ
ncbi:hypothetical protein [Streptomyces sp. NPDC001948]